MKENVLLAPLTTFQIGGPARYFTEAHSVQEVVDGIRFARGLSLKIFVLGGGSNIVVSDKGFDGLTIAMRIRGISVKKQLVTVGSGEIWDDFVLWSIDQGLAGLECMSGVPGTVGGAVVANVGCYGAQISDTLVHVEMIDMHAENSRVQIVSANDCKFSYHKSKFARESGRYIIISATFALATNHDVVLSYKDNRFDMTKLETRLKRKPSQREVRDAVLQMREKKGALIMEGRESFKCAGSFFHMPFVSSDKYAQIMTQARVLDVSKEERLRPWAWEQPDGSYKIAPGFLLEYTEFQKGYVRGTVGISPRHTLSIVNVANASAKNIAELARDMQEAVEKIFRVRLEREVEYVGNVI